MDQGEINPRLPIPRHRATDQHRIWIRIEEVDGRNDPRYKRRKHHTIVVQRNLAGTGGRLWTIGGHGEDKQPVCSIVDVPSLPHCAVANGKLIGTNRYQSGSTLQLNSKEVRLIVCHEHLVAEDGRDVGRWCPRHDAANDGAECCVLVGERDARDAKQRVRVQAPPRRQSWTRILECQGVERDRDQRSAIVVVKRDPGRGVSWLQAAGEDPEHEEPWRRLLRGIGTAGCTCGKPQLVYADGDEAAVDLVLQPSAEAAPGVAGRGDPVRQDLGLVAAGQPPNQTT